MVVESKYIGYFFPNWNFSFYFGPRITIGRTKNNNWKDRPPHTNTNVKRLSRQSKKLNFNMEPLFNPKDM